MELGQVVGFYDRHPINERQILDTLARRGKDLSALTPEDLFDLDQDHYGGLQAVETLGRLGGIDRSSRVLDLCSGLGGPARFLASRFGCRVAGVDLTHSRCARLAFTDWVAGPRLSPGERRRLSEWMAAAGVESLDGYRQLLARAGFGAIEAQDLSDWWRRILRERLQMYRRLKADTVARFGQARYEEYDQLYAFFVGLVEAGKLGGGRFSATRSA